MDQIQRPVRQLCKSDIWSHRSETESYENEDWPLGPSTFRQSESKDNWASRRPSCVTERTSFKNTTKSIVNVAGIGEKWGAPTEVKVREWRLSSELVSKTAICGSKPEGSVVPMPWRTSVQFSHSVVSNSLWPHESQHARPPCPSPTPRVHSNVHWVGDAIQPSHPLSSPSPPAPNPSQHQSLFQWVNSSHEMAKVLEFQL